MLTLVPSEPDKELCQARSPHLIHHSWPSSVYRSSWRPLDSSSSRSKMGHVKNVRRLMGSLPRKLSMYAHAQFFFFLIISHVCRLLEALQECPEGPWTQHSAVTSASFHRCGTRAKPGRSKSDSKSMTPRDASLRLLIQFHIRNERIDTSRQRQSWWGVGMSEAASPKPSD